MCLQMYSMNLETVIADKLRINQMKKKGRGSRGTEERCGKGDRCKEEKGRTNVSQSGLDLGMFDHVVDSVANSSDEDYTNWGCWGWGVGVVFMLKEFSLEQCFIS